MKPLSKLAAAVVLSLAALMFSPVPAAASCDPQEAQSRCNDDHTSWVMENMNSCFHSAGLTFYETSFVCYYDEDGCYTGYYGEGYCQEW